MKAEIIKNEVKFEPFSLKLTFESNEEVNGFIAGIRAMPADLARVLYEQVMNLTD